jgi:hypothetical protein
MRWGMRFRMFVGTVFAVGALAAGTVASSGDVLRGRQTATVYLTEPTMIGTTLVHGPVVFTHDDAKMARGEPCTTVYIEPGNGAADEVASFHCIPIPRKVVDVFTITTRPNKALGYGCVLTEYQFAGDSEGHGVPSPIVYAH